MEIGPVSGVTVRNSSGDRLLRFESDGDVLVFSGAVYPSASAADLTPSSETSEFIVKDSTGSVVALLREGPGDLYIKGAVFEKVTGLSADPNKQEFLAKDEGGVVQSLIDEDGNLKMRRDVMVAE